MRLTTTLMATLACTEALKLESKAEFDFGRAFNSIGDTFSGIGGDVASGISNAFDDIGKWSENAFTDITDFGASTI